MQLFLPPLRDATHSLSTGMPSRHTQALLLSQRILPLPYLLPVVRHETQKLTSILESFPYQVPKCSLCKGRLHWGPRLVQSHPHLDKKCHGAYSRGLRSILGAIEQCRIWPDPRALGLALIPPFTCLLLCFPFFLFFFLLLSLKDEKTLHMRSRECRMHGCWELCWWRCYISAEIVNLVHPDMNESLYFSRIWRLTSHIGMGCCSLRRPLEHVRDAGA